MAICASWLFQYIAYVWHTHFQHNVKTMIYASYPFPRQCTCHDLRIIIIFKIFMQHNFFPYNVYMSIFHNNLHIISIFKIMCKWWFAHHNHFQDNAQVMHHSHFHDNASMMIYSLQLLVCRISCAGGDLRTILISIMKFQMWQQHFAV